MPTLSGILSNAATALRAQQLGLQVTSHNISNASVEGYSRQRAVLAANHPIVIPEGAFGTGVGVLDVQQVRDQFLEANFHFETGDASYHQARSNMLVRMETLLGEPGEAGLAGTIDRFLSAWSSLATGPVSAPNRSVVRQRATDFLGKMHEVSSNLDRLRQDVEARLTVAADRISQLTSDIARFNEAIVTTEAGGVMANDLRDARGRALDELASLVPARVHVRENGAVAVSVSGVNIVDGPDHKAMRIAASGGSFGLEIVGRPGSIPELGGSVGGLLEVLNTDLPGAVQMLDDFAAAMVTEVNSLHATGTNPLGNTGIDFFDPTATTAWSMALSADVAADIQAIAAGTPDGAGGYRAGANDVALAIGGLRDNPLGALGTTPGEHVRGLVSSIALAVRSSTDAADVHQTLADQADVRRMSLSGVSVDEELVQMIQFQTAYQSAARVVTTVDEMLETILAM